MGRNFSVRPSDLVRDGDIGWLDFDRACNLRLLIYDNEQKKEQAKLNSMSTASGMNGEVLKFEGEQDKYGESEAQVM